MAPRADVTARCCYAGGDNRPCGARACVRYALEPDDVDFFACSDHDVDVAEALMSVGAVPVTAADVPAGLFGRKVVKR